MVQVTNVGTTGNDENNNIWHQVFGMKNTRQLLQTFNVIAVVTVTTDYCIH
jgi:hypothetical protein